MTKQTPLGAHSHHLQCSTGSVVTQEHQPLVETSLGRERDLHNRLGDHLSHASPPQPMLARRLRKLYSAPAHCARQYQLEPFLGSAVAGSLPGGLPGDTEASPTTGQAIP